MGLALATPVTGQDVTPPASDQNTVPGLSAPADIAQSPILTIDPDRLFSQSLFGQTAMSALNADTETLAAENRRIEADLTAEEKDLAVRRPTMAAEAFRAEAEAFDTKVQEIRQAQDAKERALQESLTTGRDRFFEAARPVLGQLMLARGAALVLDRRSVFLSVSAIDITDEAITAIDAAMGNTIPTAEPAESQN